MVNKSNASMSIDDVLSTSIFVDTFQFFRANYSNETSYIAKLDDLVMRMNKLGDKLKISTKNVRIVDFLDDYYCNWFDKIFFCLNSP